MHNVDRRMLEEWRKFESGVLAEKRMVESILSMLSGITFENVFAFVRIEKSFCS